MMTMKTMIVSKIKILTWWLSLLATGLIIAPNAYMMPSEVCVYTKITRVKVRLRAALIYIDENKVHKQRGDIYPESYQELPARTNQYTCLNTNTLVNLFRAKGLGDNDHYLTKVRVDVKLDPDCQLSGVEAVHAWMDAPKTDTVSFHIKDSFLWLKCERQ